jgi:diketogulonate reductase-like aldo/keto reductase
MPDETDALCIFRRLASDRANLASMNTTTTLPLHTGREMPIIGLGTWQLTEDTAGTVHEALRLGYRMIDTSGDYGTQPGIGEGLRRTDVDRDEIYLVTKVEEYDDAYEATVTDLRELGLEYADLMLIHRPPPRGPGRELWEGLIRAREDGLTRDIGVSNYSIEQMEQLSDATGERPVVNQIEWTPFGWSREMLDYCREHGIVIQAYSPLTRTRRLDDETLKQLAGEYQKTPAQVLLRWNVQLGSAALPKANRRDHLVENLEIFDFELNDAHLAQLERLNDTYSSLGSLPYV